eukprot:TRINITY_DN28285_c0_g1_i1.p1 TRINITY_DN28285_c0_g1~~TRINITY_DN28285_c0_g1_i1.p1  ORF type:complete len:1481 (+),score=302.33 TRINITY_DN28285_c0_g1_i1:105-4445(+)
MAGAWLYFLLLGRSAATHATRTRPSRGESDTEGQCAGVSCYLGAADAGVEEDHVVSLLQRGPGRSIVPNPASGDAGSGEHGQIGFEKEVACGSDMECCELEMTGHLTTPQASPQPVGPQGNTSCSYFCDLSGSERNVVKTQASWHDQGFCLPKWQGWCSEDEQCPKGEICNRVHLGQRKLTGVCQPDLLCATKNCGRGTCLAGYCNCDFGFAGPTCNRSVDAFAFLFYGNSSVHLLETRTLVRSLRASGSLHDILAIVPSANANETSKDFLKILENDGVRVVHMESIPMPESMDIDPVIHMRWSGVMSKFVVWGLTDYSRVALLDLDMVMDAESEEPGLLFAECTADLCAVRDGDPRFLNAGLMVVKPSVRRLEHLIAALHAERHHYEFPEQSFLTRYAENPMNGMSLLYLDRKWNSCVGGGPLLNSGFASSGYNMLHFCSWGFKAPEVRWCITNKDCKADEMRHSLLVWQQHHAAVDKCIIESSKEECSQQQGCSWCGHYCSDKQVPCSAKLFQADDAVNMTMDKEKCLLSRNATGWETMLSSERPTGWWAWPRGALYQLLVDRFAPEDDKSAQKCEDLFDYCGGTFNGMQSKLDYLQKLGVDGMVMSPVVENMPKGYHGYYTKDLNKVNPRFGTRAALKELVGDAHRRGFKVMADVNLNHAGDPSMNGTNRPEDLKLLQPFNDPSYYHTENCELWVAEEDFKGRQRLEVCKLYGMPDYNHENPYVRRSLLQWLRRHVDEFGFDGVRVDAARHMPKRFLDDIGRNGAPIPRFSEVVHGDPKLVNNYVNDDVAALYNYPLYFTLRDVFIGTDGHRKPMTELESTFGIADNEQTSVERRLTLNFIDNNDLPRFIRLVDGDEALYHNALLYIHGAEGVPVLFYGSEQNAWGLEGAEKENTYSRVPLWEMGYGTEDKTFRLLQRILWLRKLHDGLHHFQSHLVYSDHNSVVFSRGPFLFAVTSMGNASKTSQRTVYVNHTSFHASCEPTTMCDLLYLDGKDCTSVAPHQAFNLEFQHGRPKLYVPEGVFDYYMKQSAPVDHLPDDTSGDDAESAWAAVWPVSGWSSVATDPPSVTMSTLPRIPLSMRLSRRADASDRRGALLSSLAVPAQLDVWYPPLARSSLHVWRATVHDACIAPAGSGGSDKSLLYARRGDSRFLLCREEKSADCSAQLARLRTDSASANSAEAFGEKPLVVLLDDATSQLAMVSQLLPQMMPFLQGLKEGSMKLFLDPFRGAAGKDKQIHQLLSRLGVQDIVSANSSLGGSEVDGAIETAEICAREVHLPVASDSVVLEPKKLLKLRRELRLPTVGCEIRGAVMIQSDGTSPKIARLEEQAGEAVSRELSPYLSLLHPSEEDLERTMEVLSCASTVIGVSGEHMASMLYASAGSKIIEIVPEGPSDDSVRILAGALGLDYAAVPAETVEADLANHALLQQQNDDDFSNNFEGEDF